MSVILIAVYFVIPVLILFAVERYKIASKIGAVLIAYGLGLLLGHVGIIPRPGVYLYKAMQDVSDISPELITEWIDAGLVTNLDLRAFKIYKLQETLTSVTIPLALPLLLFSLRLKSWIRMSGKTLLSMLLAMFAVVIFITWGHVLFGDKLKDSDKIAGMLVGLYTGGTPNLAALKQSLGVDAETYIMTHTYDTAIGIVYLLFIITVGKRLFRFFLKPYPIQKSNTEDLDYTESGYSGIFKKQTLNKLLLTLLVACSIVGVSVGIASFFQDSFMLVVILSITSLGILASFIPQINNIPKTFELGMYFIIVFSFVVASMADISKLINISSALLAYITFVYCGALIAHALLCKLFRVDADTLMVTSTALLCSPPFVPMVAGALKNKEVVMGGLAVGIMGYAVGNYLGTILAALL